MTPEQSGLLEKARRSIESAKVLSEHGDHDFAASRAYYAMFYVAEAFLLAEGLAFSSHSGVIAAFGEHFAKTRLLDSRFHRYLMDGEETWLKSDYDIGVKVTEAEAAEQIAHAEEFVQAAKKFLAAPDAR